MKLNFELVPDSCWCSNLRSALPKAQWDIIRKKAYARAGGKCTVCGVPTTRLEAHEQWHYDDEKCVQSLANIIAVYIGELLDNRPIDGDILICTRCKKEISRRG